MNIMIDDYYISYNEQDGFYSVFINSNNIINDKIICNSKSCAIARIIESIEQYNNKHGLCWNFTEKKYPCKDCNIGWSSISTTGSKSCFDTCEKLKKYLEN